MSNAEEAEVVPRRCEDTDWRRAGCRGRAERKMVVTLTLSAGEGTQTSAVWACEKCAARMARHGWLCVRTRAAEEASS